MAKSIHGTKKRGRPPTTGTGAQIGMRWQGNVLSAIDEWRRQEDDLPGRPEAIRRLVELGLSASAPVARPVSPRARAKAAELAHQAIEQHADSSATPKERESRKRRLLKGPKEFREMRKDHK